MRDVGVSRVAYAAWQTANLSGLGQNEGKTVHPMDQSAGDEEVAETERNTISGQRERNHAR